MHTVLNLALQTQRMFLFSLSSLDARASAYVNLLGVSSFFFNRRSIQGYMNRATLFTLEYDKRLCAEITAVIQHINRRVFSTFQSEHSTFKSVEHLTFKSVEHFTHKSEEHFNIKSEYHFNI